MGSQDFSPQGSQESEVGERVSQLVGAPRVYALVVPIEPGGAMGLLKRAVADLRPSFLVIARPQGVGASIADKVSDAVVDFAKSIDLVLNAQVVEVPVKLVDGVVAVRRAIMHAKALANTTLYVHFAIFDGSPTWLNTVLLYTASVVRSLTWEFIGLGKVRYYGVDGFEDLVKPARYVDLNPTDYLVLKIIARGHATAKEIHEVYVKEVEPVSRQLINATLARLNQRRLVNMVGSGKNYYYQLTNLGRMIVG
ncbi:MAG: hypothetical protein RXN91_06325 [Caldivirga sp.]